MNRLMNSPQWLPHLDVRRQQKTQKKGVEEEQVIIEIMGIKIQPLHIHIPPNVSYPTPHCFTGEGRHGSQLHDIPSQRLASEKNGFKRESQGWK